MRRIAAYLIVLLMPFAAVAQDDDRGFLQGLLEDNLSGAGREVRIEGFTGALSAEASIERLTIADDAGIWLTLTGVTLDWNRGALLRGRLEVNRLSADTIDLPRLPQPSADAPLPTPEASGFSLPELPVSVNIGEISSPSIRIGQPVLGVAAEFSLEGSLSLEGGAGRAALAVVRTDGVAGTFDLDAGYANDTRMLDLALTLDEAPGGIVSTLAKFPGAPSVNLAVDGSGPLDAFEATLDLSTDGAERLAGRLALGAPGTERPEGAPLPFSAELGGDVAPLFAPDYRDFFGPDIRLRLAGTRDADGTLDLGTFGLSARALALDGQLRIAPDGLPERFALAGRIAAAAGGPVLLPIPGERTTVNRVDLDLNFDTAEGDAWRGSFVIAGLDRPGFSAERVTLDGTGRIAVPVGESGARGFTANLDFAAESLDLGDPRAGQALGERVTGRVEVTGAPDVPLEIARIEINGESYELTASGTVDTSNRNLEIAGRAAVAARDLSVFAGIAQRPLRGSADLSLEGSGAVLGGQFDVALEGRTADLAVGIPEADNILAGSGALSLSARRDETGITLEALRLGTPVARITAEGVVKSAGSSINLSASLDDAALVLPGLDGRHTLSLIATGDGTVWTLRGSLAGDAVTAAVNGVLDDRRATRGFDGTVSLTARDIAPFGPFVGREGLAGAVEARADGRIRADLSSFDIRLGGTATDLAVGLPDIDGLLEGEVTLTLDAAREGGPVTLRTLAATSRDVDAEAQGTISGLPEIVIPDGIAALADGTTDPVFEGTARVSARSLSGLASIARLPGLGGAVEASAEGRVSASLESLDLRLDANGANLRTGISAADEFLAGGSVLSIDAARQDGRILLRRARFASPALTARLDGDVGPDGGALSAEVELDNIGRIVEGFSGAATATLEATRADNSPWQVNVAATGPGGLTLRTDGTIAADLGSVDLGVTGTAPLGLANSFISPRSLGGQAAFDLRVRGVPSLAAVSGRISTSDARLVAPTLGIVIDRTEGGVTLSGARAEVGITATVQGGGQVRISGGAGLTAPFQGAIRADLDRVRLSDPELYETRVTGSVTAEGPLAGGAAIAGRLTLDQTEIRIPSGISGGIEPIPDIVHVAEPRAVRATRDRAGLIAEAGGNGQATRRGVPYTLDVRIDALNQIFVRGRGLDAELGGSLTVRGTTANVVPQGRFELIRGRIDILGKRIVLNEGAITIEGDFNPYIRLVASTEAQDVTVRIILEGPASDPQISFTSEPELPEDEVLARLLFGRGIETLSPLQAAQLASAVATLSGRGGNGVLSKLREGFGLDDLDVSSDEAGATELRLGKYISDNLYTNVVIGSEGTTEIQLNLDLTPSVTVTGRATDAGETGVGVFYERDY